MKALNQKDLGLCETEALVKLITPFMKIKNGRALCKLIVE